jgi:hypothetical protein
MTSDLLTVTKIEEYARSARGLAEVVLSAPPPALDPTIASLVREISTAAAAIEELANGAVKIGVVGKFNAGKTLLLGSLIGYADGLPVESVATTGNVTAIRFRQREGMSNTTFDGFGIEYFEPTEARECLAALLAEAGKVGREAGLAVGLLDQLARIRPTDPATDDKIEPWAAAAWAAAVTPDLRPVLRELVWFVRAYFRCGPGMCGSGPYPVSPAVARDGLTLPPPPGDLQSLPYASLPVAPPAVATPPAALTADLIRHTFPLIKRVRVEVTVSRGVWDLAGLVGANAFELYDFPGLGSAFSGVRDRFLCERELRQIHTVLVLLSAIQPGEKGWDGVMAPLQRVYPDLKDVVLAGVSRFDQLPLGPGGLATLARLAGPIAPGLRQPVRKIDLDEDDAPPSARGGSLSEAALLAEVRELNDAVAAARQLVPAGRADRIALVSPMLGLKTLADAESRVQVGSDRFVADLPANATEAKNVQPLWKGVADRLAAGGPAADGVGRWLADFAADGGIDRMRKLILKHVQTNGLRLHAQAVRAAAAPRNPPPAPDDGLRNKIDRLAALVTPPDPAAPRAGLASDPDDREAVRVQLNALAAFYRRLADTVKDGWPLAVRRDDVPVAVTTACEREAVFRVYEWGVWATLGHATRWAANGDAGNNGYITQTRRIVVEDDDEGDEPAAVATAFPTRSDDLHPPFVATLAELAGFTQELVQEGLNGWLGGLGREMPEVGRVAELVDAKGAGRGAAGRVRRLGLGEPGDDLVAYVRLAVDPPRLKRVLEKNNPDVLDVVGRRLDPVRLFPLALTAGPERGRVFGWAEELTQHKNPLARPDRNLAHSAQVLRVRDDIVSVLTEEMAQTVSLAGQRIGAGLADILANLNGRLAVAAGNDAVLDALLTPAADPDAPAADPAAADDADPTAAVRQLAALRWPLSA